MIGNFFYSLRAFFHSFVSVYDSTITIMQIWNSAHVIKLSVYYAYYQGLNYELDNSALK